MQKPINKILLIDQLRRVLKNSPKMYRKWLISQKIKLLNRKKNNQIKIFIIKNHNQRLKREKIHNQKVEMY